MRIGHRPLLGFVAAGAMTVAAAPVGARAQDVQAVPGPSNLQATAVSASRIDLRWTTANSGQVVEYRVYYADGTLLDAVPASEDRYSDTGLQPWTEYRYYVTGANSSGNESPPSNVVSARTLDGTPPSTPGNLKGTATSSTQVSLSWSAATDAESGIDDYVVYRNGGEIGRTSGLTFQNGGLSPDTEYGYQVSAVNGQGEEGNRTGTVTVRTLSLPPPDPPRDLSATAVSASAIDLDWRAPADDGDVAAYRIYRNGSPVGTVTSTSYRDTGLSSYTVFTYRVTSVNPGGDESDPSNEASARTLDGSPPTKPGNLAGSAVSQTQIALTWSAASDPQTGISEYVVYRGGSEIGRTGNQTYQDGNLTPDASYSYEVSAVNGQGQEGSRAGPVQVRTLADPTPDPPRDLTAAAFSASAIDLDWRAPADDGNVTSYRIYRNGSPVGTATTTGFRDTGLSAYTTYEYRVRSVSGDGDESAPSNSASARTLDGSPPTAPGNLAGSAISKTRISLAWSSATDPQTGVAEYVVYRDGAEIGRTGALTYEDGGLESDQLYAYEVSAVNGQGAEGSRAGPLEVRTLSDVAPDPPTGLTASAVDDSSVDLAWDPHPDSNNLDSYRVYRDGLLVTETRETSFRDTGLTPFTTYVYTVTAVGEDGDESPPSAPAIVTTPDLTPPTVPENVLATPVGTQRIDVSWSPSSDEESGVSGYRVFRDGAEVAFTEAAVFADAGLSPGTMYEYRVRAVNGFDLESEPSEPSSATTFDQPGPPLPLDLEATPGGPTQIVLTWTSPAEEITGYNIYRDGAFVGSVTSTTFVDTGLQPETSYGYALASLIGDMQGERTSVVFATTLAVEDRTPPAPPTGLRLVTP